MLDFHDRAVKPQANCAMRLIQLTVVRFSSYDIFHSVARHGCRDQRPNKQSSHGSVPIREMKDVRLFLFAFAEVKAIESRVGERMIVVSSFVTLQCRNSFNTHAE